MKIQSTDGNTTNMCTKFVLENLVLVFEKSVSVLKNVVLVCERFGTLQHKLQAITQTGTQKAATARGPICLLRALACVF